MSSKGKLLSVAPPVGVPDWVQKLRGAMFAAVSEQDVRDMMQAIVKDAKNGDAQSRKLILDYVLGGGVRSAIQNNLVISPAQPKSKLDILRERAEREEPLTNFPDDE